MIQLVSGNLGWTEVASIGQKQNRTAALDEDYSEYE